MRYIELTGSQLRQAVSEAEITEKDLQNSGVRPESIVRVNEQGDIEVRRPDRWDVVGGLLGDYQHRLERITGLRFA